MWAYDLRSLSNGVNAFSNVFHRRQPHHIFQCETWWQYSDGDPLPGASNAGVWQNRNSRPISGLIACCQRWDRQVLYTQLRRTVASWWHSLIVAISGVGCCSRKTDDEVFMTRSLNVTPKTPEQNLIVRIGKSETKVTNNKKTALEILYCWS